MTVMQNLLFFSNDKSLAEKLLMMTNIKDLANRYPMTLSGGEQQRVALCRAMMNRPKLLLLDEPLSALDSKTKHEVQEGIAQLHHEFGATIIMTSHDTKELHRLAERIITIESGRIISDELAYADETTRGELLELTTNGDKREAIILVDNKKIKVDLGQI